MSSGKFSDAVQRSREQLNAAAGLVRLRADPVVLVFDERALGKRFDDFLRCASSDGQHEAHGLEQTQVRLSQVPRCHQAQRLADVAGQHVGALDRFEWLVERPGNHLFDQALFQANPQVVGDNLDDVFHFQRARAAKKLFERSELRRRAASLGQIGERLRKLARRKPSGRPADQQLSRHSSQVAVLAIDLLHRFCVRTRQPADGLPEDRASNRENSLLAPRESAAREEKRGKLRIFS
jgi:hypothetical protein